MQAYKSRLDSFSKPIRVKNASLTTSSPVRWPHPTSYAATPHTLAEAGFYFNPSWDDRDNVTCFTCGKELSDWTQTDDPFEIHWVKCRASCVWAVVRCGLKEDVDQEGRFLFTNKTRLPAGKAMTKARLATFTTNGWWPHDAAKNHGANSKKMAQAGFVYTPQVTEDDSRDDTATCLYCNISLGGWDPEDDPLEEHKKREKRSRVPCPFFASVTSRPELESVPVPAPPSPKPPTSKSSKPKQSLKLSRSKKPEESEEGDAQAAEESDDELELAPAPVRKGRSKSGAKTSGKAGRESDAEGSMRRKTRAAGSRAGSVMSEEDVSSTKGKAKGRGKGKKKQEEVIEEEDEEVLVVPEKVVEKPKRGRPRKTVVQEKEADEMDKDANADTPPEPPKSKSKAKSKPKPARSKSHATVEAGIETDIPAAASVPLPKTRSKLTSKPKSTRSKSHVGSDSDAPDTRPVSKPTRSKSCVNTKIELELDVPVPVFEPPKATSSKAKTSGKKKVANEDASMDVDEEHVQRREEAAAEVNEKGKGRKMKVVDISTDDEDQERAVSPEHKPQTKKGQEKPLKTGEAEGEYKHDGPEPFPMDIFPAPSTPPRPVLSGSLSGSPQRVAPLTNGHHHSPSPSPPTSTPIQSFLPPLALLPIPHIVSLSEAEQDMTVEAWIRHEISLQYEQLKSDGERRIDAFKGRAEEVRRRIDAL